MANFDAIIKTKEDKMLELRKALVETEDKESRSKINDAMNELEKEINELRGAVDEINAPATTKPEIRGTELMTVGTTTENTNVNVAETRANEFAKTNRMTIANDETRAAILVSGNNIAQPVGVGGINDAMPAVSSIVDLVKIVDASGMGGGYVIAYEKNDATAANHTEGSDITESEPTFGVVKVTASDKALVSYISNKVRKQSPLTYEAKVRDAAMTALRKAASKICVDAVYTSTIVDFMEIGLDNANKGVLDEKFLRKITLNYGGDEAVMGGAVLFLNKKDLIALGDVTRGTDKKPVYEITPDATNPNTGIIRDGGLAVKYCINNNCAALAGTAQPAKSGSDVLGCFYGNPQSLELAMFSDYEVSTSEEYKFAQDMMTVRGTASMGAGVGAYKGFVVAKISKAAN